MPRKPNKNEPGQQESTPKVDPQKQFLMDQFGGLMEKVGEGYGGPLQEELIRRLEKTIEDFHEEVSGMLESLKESSEKRHEKLKEIWDNPDVESASGNGGGSDEPHADESDDDNGGELSDWEKRIEAKAQGAGRDDSGGGKEAEKEEDAPKKKRGLFGRKKK